ncbi:MAG: hypothetical protein HRT71_04555 [Flavobacteriales bacterium]|nr:hypothetical protein [Flavobacteriales bacterium]
MKQVLLFLMAIIVLVACKKDAPIPTAEELRDPDVCMSLTFEKTLNMYSSFGIVEDSAGNTVIYGWSTNGF